MIKGISLRQLPGRSSLRRTAFMITQRCTLVTAAWFAILILSRATPSASERFLGVHHYACHNSTSCAVAHMTCDADQRLALLSVRHAHHVSGTPYGDCPVLSGNCSAASPNVSSADCAESYDKTVLIAMYDNCSAARDPAVPVAKATCSLELPSSPQMSSGPCVNQGYQSLSSYSLVDYKCINESQISSLCGASVRNGTLLFALWNPREQTARLASANITSTCQCRVTSSDDAEMYVYIRPMDVRMPQADTDDCSRLTVRDSSSSKLNSSCRDSGTLLYGTHLLETGEITARTPIDLTLLLDQRQLPHMAWIGFSSYSERALVLICKSLDELFDPLPTDSVPTYSPSNDGKSRLVGAVIGGCLASLVLIAILGVTWYYIYSKRKRQMTKNSRAWWSRRRQENDVARSSMSTRSSNNVVVDTGKHIGYGAKPPIHKSYPASTNNRALDIVPGSANPQTKF